MANFIITVCPPFAKNLFTRQQLTYVVGINLHSSTEKVSRNTAYNILVYET